MSSKRVALYCRVSTKDQTTENQLLDLRNYCQARQWEIAAEFVDHAMSGTKDDRPQLKALMTSLRHRKFQAVLVWRFDRFSRSLLNLVSTLEEMRVLGIDFVSFQEGIDTSTSTGRMVFGIVASLAAFEREVIVERVRAGLRRAVAQGKQLGRPRAILDLSHAQELASRGESHVAIGRALGVSRMTVARVLAQKPKIASVRNELISGISQ